MRPGPAPVHYLRPNDKVWTPPALITLDSETRPVELADRRIEVLRCWDAHYLDRRTRKKVTPRDDWGAGEDAPSLVEWVQTVTRNRDTVWLYCHNLSFDLATTRLPQRLVAAGWKVTDAAIGGKAPWLRLAHGKRVLTMCDSWSWLPVALDQVGQAVQVSKPPLPGEADELTEWHRRCRADVEILETALLDLMGWWDRHALGRWTISGAGCGWNAFRHRTPPRQVIVDPDPDAVAADRAAIHGGRRAVFSIGEHRAGPFLELDFVAAYPSIAANCPLPAKRGRAFTSLPLDDHKLSSDRWGVIARVLVETDVPRWPVKIGRHNWYPTGTFWATLAGPEIAEARRLGCLRQIGPGHVHRLGYAMQPWAQWVLAVMRDELPDTPPVAKIAAKSWSRSVIGKWAARGFERHQLGPATSGDWTYEEGWDHETGTKGGLVQLGGKRWWVTSAATPDNTYPAVLAWVESEVRVRLSRVLEAIGTGAVLQADTDGLIVAQRNLGTVSAHGHLRAPSGTHGAERVAWVLNCLDPVTAPLTLRVKRAASHVTVTGPQHLRVDGTRRYAGLPGMATETATNEFDVLTWPKLAWQLKHGDTAGYVRPRQHVRMAGPYPTGWLLDTGKVVPLEAELGIDGQTRAVPWQRSSYRVAGARLAEIQHPQLHRFW